MLRTAIAPLVWRAESARLIAYSTAVLAKVAATLQHAAFMINEDRLLTTYGSALRFYSDYQESRR